MNIKKEELKELIENAFYSGMNCGYGVDHENIHEDEDNCWKKYSESLDVFKTVIPKCSECEYCKQIGKKNSTYRSVGRKIYYCKNPYNTIETDSAGVPIVHDFIGYGTNTFDSPLVLKTSPKWCPKKTR